MIRKVILGMLLVGAAYATPPEGAFPLWEIESAIDMIETQVMILESDVSELRDRTGVDRMAATLDEINVEIVAIKRALQELRAVETAPAVATEVSATTAERVSVRSWMTSIAFGFALLGLYAVLFVLWRIVFGETDRLW